MADIEDVCVAYRDILVTHLNGHVTTLRAKTPILSPTLEDIQASDILLGPRTSLDLFGGTGYGGRPPTTDTRILIQWAIGSTFREQDQMNALSMVDVWIVNVTIATSIGTRATETAWRRNTRYTQAVYRTILEHANLVAPGEPLHGDGNWKDVSIDRVMAQGIPDGEGDVTYMSSFITMRVKLLTEV